MEDQQEAAVLEPMQEQSSALSLITGSEILAQVSTAKKYPRELSRFSARALQLATYDVETAQGCIYSVPRAGKKLTGPSIRFAEIVASAWGNLRIAARVLGNDGKVIKVEAVCHDLETNVAYKIEKDRKITDRQGKTFSEDMIVVTGNAAASIAIRDAIMRVIPKAVSKGIYDKVRQIAVGDKTGGKTFTKRRDDAMAFFKSLNIEPERVLAAVEKRKVEDLDLDDLETLLGLATALKNGDSTPEEVFPLPAKPDMKFGSDAGATETVTVGSHLDNEHIAAIRKLLVSMAIAEKDFMRWGQQQGYWKPRTSLEELPIAGPGKLKWIIQNWKDIEPMVDKIQPELT